jgi:hypothetical protein
MKLQKGAILSKNNASYITCVKCGRELNIFNEYDYYDLNGSFIKECCGKIHTLTQHTYIFQYN